MIVQPVVQGRRRLRPVTRAKSKMELFPQLRLAPFACQQLYTYLSLFLSVKHKEVTMHYILQTETDLKSHEQVIIQVSRRQGQGSNVFVLLIIIFWP